MFGHLNTTEHVSNFVKHVKIYSLPPPSQRGSFRFDVTDVSFFSWQSKHAEMPVSKKKKKIPPVQLEFVKERVIFTLRPLKGIYLCFIYALVS